MPLLWRLSAARAWMADWKMIRFWAINHWTGKNGPNFCFGTFSKPKSPVSSPFSIFQNSRSWGCYCVKGDRRIELLPCLICLLTRVPLCQARSLIQSISRNAQRLYLLSLAYNWSWNQYSEYQSPKLSMVVQVHHNHQLKGVTRLCRRFKPSTIKKKNKGRSSLIV